MNRAFFLLLVIVLLGGCAGGKVSRFERRVGLPSAPLELVGVLSQDLEVAGEVRISGDLSIPAGRTLRILAGSQVRVLGNDSTKIDPEYLDKGTEILVRGRLEILGSVERPVSLRLDPETPTGENWSGIEVVKGGRAALTHVDLVGAEIGLLLVDGQARLQQTNLLGGRYGLLVQGGGILGLQGGRISGGDAGLLCYDQGEVRLEEVQILDNREEGLYLAQGCRLQARGSLVARNDLGLVADALREDLPGLELRDNRVDFKALGNSRGAQ